MRPRDLTIAIALLAMGNAAPAEEPSPEKDESVRAPAVRVERVPADGIQPRVVRGSDGTIHLIYFGGDPAAGDVYYVRRAPEGGDWSSPVRVNSEPGSAVAMGTIRGAHLALGRGDRVHVAWNGSRRAAGEGESAPMLYCRQKEPGGAFEPQRNLVTWASGLDGGGSVAADDEGNVFVVWHASAGAADEAGRAVYVAHSADDGATFAKEIRALEEGTGACGCCGLEAAVSGSDVYVLYRGARRGSRDMILLHSGDLGKSFEPNLVHRWKTDSCPMSSASIVLSQEPATIAWETQGQIWWAPVRASSSRVDRPRAAPGKGGGRKHPLTVPGPEGSLLFAWTEGTGWQRGGAVAWLRLDGKGRPVGEIGRRDGLPAWSFAAAWGEPDGDFVLMY